MKQQTTNTEHYSNDHINYANDSGINQYTAATVTQHHSLLITLFGWCHIILHSDKGTCVWRNCTVSLCKVEQPEDEPATC